MTCRWNGRESPRLTRSHLAECAGGCEGCGPCPERHCQVCGLEHVTSEGRGTDQTCATCVGIVREAIPTIVALSGRVLTEATHRGVNSEAAMLAGPAADPEAFGYRRMSALAGRIDAAWLDTCRDEKHPLWVLGTWEMLIRQHLDQPSLALVDVHVAAAYIDGHLTRLAHDEGFAFEELARDLRDCQGYIEDVLHEGEREERGAPCYACGRANLVKVYGETDDGDRWTCPRCKQWWTEDDYRAKVEGIYVQQADRLTASQIAVTYRVPEGTVRRWASGNDATVRTRGKDRNGRQLYDVDDVVTRRDTQSA